MILIIDFGGQSAHLIGRRLKNLGIEFALCSPKDALGVVNEEKPSGIIFSGGPASVYEDEAPDVDASIFEVGIPILAICYGWQLMAHKLGGDVKPHAKEYGKATLQVQSAKFKVQNDTTLNLEL